MKRIKVILVSVLLVMTSMSVLGQVNNWNGADGASWNVAGNWSLNHVPTSAEKVFFPSGTYSIINVTQQTVLQIELGTGAHVTLNGASVYLSFKNSTSTDLLIPSGSTLLLQGIILRPYDNDITATIAGTMDIGANSNYFLNTPYSSVTTVTGTGKIINRNLLQCSSSNASRLVFQSGGIYEHALNGSNIPYAVWQSGSVCMLSGITNLLPGQIQVFSDFTWNCASQSAPLSLAGTISSSNITGTFKVVATNGQSLVFGQDFTLQNLTVEGGLLRFTVQGHPTSVTVNISGNLTVTGGNLTICNLNTPVNNTLNVAGNFVHTAGTISEADQTAGTSAIINFNGNSPQTYTGGGTNSGTVYYNVLNGSTVLMGTGVSPSTLTGPDSYFSLAAGGTLGITSPFGITATGTGGTSGNIQVGQTRTYSSSANYIFMGNTQQAQGAGFPASPAGNVGVAAGASFSPTTNLSFNGTLVVDGTLAPASDRIIGGTGTLSGTGTINISRTGSTALADQYTISNKVLTGLTLNFNAATGSAVVPAGTYGGLTLTNVSVSLGGNVTLNGTLNRTSPGTLTIGLNQLSAVNLVNSGTITLNSNSTTSGSLIVSGSVTNNTGSAVRYSRQLRSNAAGGDRHFLSSPVANLPVSTFTSENSTKIATSGSVYQIWRYNENFTDPADEWPLVTSGNLQSGTGYNLDQALGSDGYFTFSGVYTNGTSLTLSSPYSTPSVTGATQEEYDLRWQNNPSRSNWGGGGWHFLGNPFAAALNASAFMTANGDYLDPNYQALYVYDGLSGDHGTYTPVTTTVQAGQGFAVLADYNGVQVSFTPAMQQSSPATLVLKSSKTEQMTEPGIKLKVLYGEWESSSTVVYGADYTPGLDPGHDLGQLSTSPDVEIYTVLNQDNGVNFVKQALPLEGCDRIVVPVGIDSENGSQVTFTSVIVPVEGYKFYLEDRLTGAFTNLNSENYPATIAPKTYGTGRFFLHLSSSALTGAESEEPSKQDIRAWYYRNQLILQGSVGRNATCTVMTMNGTKITEKRLNEGDYNTVALPSEVHGVIIVTVKEGNKKVTRKIPVL